MISVIMPIYLLDEQLVKITNECLAGLKQQKEPYELIIVDNNGGMEHGFKNEADIYVYNKKNVGNGQAWSQGMKLANGEYLWFIDNDLHFVDKYAIIKLRKHLENNAKTGIVFPMSKNSDQQAMHGQLSGFCWMTRREVINKLGHISNDMPYPYANFEDTDFFMRAITAGYELKVEHDAFVEHVSRATCDKVPAVKENYELNHEWYDKKWNKKYPYIT